jgi:hypothetical protein
MANWTFSVSQIEFEVTLDVQFSNSMLQNADLIKTTNYSFTEGVYVRKVDILTNSSVRLWVENFGENTTVLTINNIKDVDDDLILDINNHISVTPFQSTATFSNTNGLIRTSRNSIFVQADSQRVYFGGVKGIDVFRKISSSVFSRWAQIYDTNGIDAMFVANFPNDLIISDELPPFLDDIFPTPESAVGVNTTISFDVIDTTTSVEPTNINIYINDVIIFSGNSGWVNGYYGTIEVGFKQLNIEIKKETNFVSGDTIVVRVLATDLLNNSADESFTFYIS